MDRINAAVVQKLLDRVEKGVKKYGVNMEREDLSIKEWLEHFQDELLDAAVYAEKLIQELGGLSSRDSV